MIKISAEQSQQILMADREDFILRLQKDVVEESPWVAQAWPSVLIHALVSYAFDRATIANGFKIDIDVQIFVSLMFAIGPDFDQHPKIHKILHDTSIPTDTRWTILTEDTNYAGALQEMDALEHQENWFSEGRGRIQDAYPTTYMLPGFIALYNKRRKEQYPYLSPGESLQDAE